MPVYTGAGYREADLSIGAPDVAALQQAESSSAWDASADPSMRRWLDAAVTRDDVLYFAIYERDKLVGQTFLHDIDSDTGDALVGYHLFEPQHRGRGLGTVALRLLQCFVREETTLTRLIAITSADNAASRRIAEKCGFVHVGAPREDPSGVLLEWLVQREGRQ